MDGLPAAHLWFRCHVVNHRQWIDLAAAALVNTLLQKQRVRVWVGGLVRKHLDRLLPSLHRSALGRGSVGQLEFRCILRKHRRDGLLDWQLRHAKPFVSGAKPSARNAQHYIPAVRVRYRLNVEMAPYGCQAVTSILTARSIDHLQLARYFER